MDVEEYLKRIGYTGSLEPTVETLHDLTLAQKTSMCYSSIRTHGATGDDRIKLTPEKTYQHMITNKGAGLCCELNGLFGWLLQQLNFKLYFGRASLYFSDKKVYSHDYFHAIPIVEIDGERYIIDPGWTLFGPMRIGVMSVYADNFHVYRMILHPEFENTPNRYLIQRHKKTVLDKDGRVIKQGPGKFYSGNEICKDDSECNKKESNHWVPFHTFSLDRHMLSDFQTSLDSMQDSLDIYLLKYEVKPKCIVHFYCDKKFSIKEAVDPLTDKILYESEARTNEEIKEIAEKYFNFKVHHPITFFKNKFKI